LIKTEYLIVGNLARIFDIEVIQMLKISIAVISIFYISLVFIIIVKIFSDKYQRIIALMLGLFATGIYHPSQTFGWVNLPKFSQVFQRMTLDAPHYMLSSLFTVASVYFISRTFGKFIWKKYLFAVISGLIAMQTFFPSMMVTLTSLGLFIGYRLIRTRKLSIYKKDLLLISSYSLIVCLPLIQLWYASNFFDMNTFKKSEFITPLIFTSFWQYVITIGPVFIFALIAIPKIFKSGQIFMELTIFWVLSHPVNIFVLSKLTNTNMARFFQTPYYIFLGISASVGIGVIYEMIKKYAGRYISIVFTSIFIILIFTSSYFSYKLSLEFNQLDGSDIVNDLGYPGIGEYQAMKWLKPYCNRNRLVMSSEPNGTLILALTPCRVYLSSWVRQGLLFDEAADLGSSMMMFYGEYLNESDAKKFLKDNKITYVYYGSAEQYFHSLGGKSGHLNYPFLKIIYDRDAIIYLVD
jgi:hypothetical protein